MEYALVDKSGHEQFKLLEKHIITSFVLDATRLLGLG